MFLLSLCTNISERTLCTNILERSMLVTPARNERLKRLTASAVLLLQLQHSRDVVRARNKRRQRLDWNSHVNDIGDSLFKRAYRLTLPAFNTHVLSWYCPVTVSISMPSGGGENSNCVTILESDLPVNG